MKLNVNEKNGIKMENKLKQNDIVDQAAKLNKIRNVQENNEFIGPKKANRKFISKDQFINQEEKDIGFREDIQKEKIIDIVDQSSAFEKEFFESFKKGPFNMTDILDEKYDENEEEEKSLLTKKGKKNKQKRSVGLKEEDDAPVDFQSNND